MKKELRERLCTAVMLGYHLLFLGGSTTLINGYLDKIDRLRTEVVNQVDRVELMAKSIDKTGKDINKNIQSTKKSLDKVRKTCMNIGIRL